LNESVTDGSCPEWLIVTGPRLLLNVATAFIGTSAPVELFTYNSANSDRSCWYCGSSSRITSYSLLGVRIVDTWREPYAS
jgi:hypothetical protein